MRAEKRFPHPSRRRGGVTVEMMLLMPILMAILVAVVEMSMLVMATQEVSEASALGARLGSRGGSSEDVRAAICHALGNGRLREAEVAVVIPPHSGEVVEVVVRIRADKAVPDVLRFIGFGLKGKELVGRTVLRKE
jgi:hypothetical protein